MNFDNPFFNLQQMQQMQQPVLGQQMLQQPMPQMDEQQHGHHGGGFNPLMMLSPFAGMMASHPKLGLSMLSPGLGLASFLGAFK